MCKVRLWISQKSYFHGSLDLTQIRNYNVNEKINVLRNVSLKLKYILHTIIFNAIRQKISCFKCKEQAKEMTETEGRWK